jgi:hypothetical protein
MSFNKKQLGNDLNSGKNPKKESTPKSQPFKPPTYRKGGSMGKRGC